MSAENTCTVYIHKFYNDRSFTKFIITQKILKLTLSITNELPHNKTQQEYIVVGGL